jgi:hypothetical protein
MCRKLGIVTPSLGVPRGLSAYLAEKNPLNLTQVILAEERDEKAR